MEFFKKKGGGAEELGDNSRSLTEMSEDCNTNVTITIYT
jgi:hypothetical protein